MRQMLGEAMRLGQAGRSEAAEKLLQRVLHASPDQPDALQLLGMLARARGANLEAIALFERSLKANPRQAHVLNNLGNALLELGRHSEAVDSYRAALQLDPGRRDARTNLGLALIASGETREACSLLQATVRDSPQDAKAWAALGRALRAQSRLDEAIAALEIALSLRPAHVATMHNLAVALRLAGRPQDALGLLRACAAADRNAPEIKYNLGHCLHDLGDLAGAIEAYRTAIALRPGDRDAHASLNRLYWQLGNEDNHLRTYREALRSRPADAGLLADFAHQLNLTHRQAEAAALLSEALARGVDGAELRHRLAQALWSQGRPDEALTQLAAGLVLDPGNSMLIREKARSLIFLERYDEALAVLGDDEGDQQALAYRGLCWHFLGDPRAARLNDHDLFVSSRVLSPPAGMGGVQAFNARLAAILGELHTMARHPLEQTLRGGTQTIGDLLDRQIPEIQAVRAMIEADLARYIASLPDDAGHPFLRRKSNGFAFSGSWSVRLGRGGYHMNHVHPEGWISSCYYVALPPSVEDGGRHSGWLKFGESALGLGAREPLARLVRPEVGMLVLFPSYFYHGTIPFEDEVARTTIAFDVVPRP